jgi:Xaa-Pro aminopeptidase
MSLDFKRRLVGLQEKMAEADLDLVVYGCCQNFQYLTGLLTEWRRGVDLTSATSNVFVPKEREPILTLSGAPSEETPATWIKDIRYPERGASYGDLVKKVVSDFGLKGGNIGLGDHLWGSTTVEIAKAVKQAKLHSAEALMDQLRMIKDPVEVERLRNVVALTDKAVENVLPKIKAGITQRELGLEIEFQGRLLGASDISFSPTAGFVKSGSEVSTNPFTYPRDKGLVSGTSIAFDVGFVLDGYCSDFGRSFYFGPANTEVKKGYEALHQGVLETVDKMRDGSLRVCDLFPALEKTLDRLGYGDYLRARLTTGNLGHNIGIEVHEPPWLSPAYTEPLHTNMVMALEPKVWHAGEYYLRVEDIVLVGPRKTEVLTKFDREIFQL